MDTLTLILSLSTIKYKTNTKNSKSFKQNFNTLIQLSYINPHGFSNGHCGWFINILLCIYDLSKIVIDIWCLYLLYAYLGISLFRVEFWYLQSFWTIIFYGIDLSRIQLIWIDYSRIFSIIDILCLKFKYNYTLKVSLNKCIIFKLF